MIVAHMGPGGTTYIIEKGKKRPIPDMATFASMRLDWANLVRLPDDQLQAIPDGVPIPAAARPGTPRGCKVIKFQCNSPWEPFRTCTTVQCS
jgi:hypothetical protein